MISTKANLFMDVSQPPLILSAWSNRMNTQAIAASPPHSRSAKENKALERPVSYMELVYPRLATTLDLCT
jgi:hypothetical protein